MHLVVELDQIQENHVFPLSMYCFVQRPRRLRLEHSVQYGGRHGRKVVSSQVVLHETPSSAYYLCIATLPCCSETSNYRYFTARASHSRQVLAVVEKK